MVGEQFGEQLSPKIIDSVRKPAFSPFVKGDSKQQGLGLFSLLNRCRGEWTVYPRGLDEKRAFRGSREASFIYTRVRVIF